MSILIKGMEMPRKCRECKFRVLDYCLAKEQKTEVYEDEIIPSWCPLIEIPPHGRLIDADEVEKKASNGEIFYIHAMPTVIEAEGRE